MPNILVFTPTYGDGPHAETIESVQRQRVARGLAWTHHVSWHNPSDDPMTNVLEQYKLARRMVLDGDYDALVCVEHDIRLSKRRTLQRLWETDAGVVYAPYMLRHGPPSLSLFRRTGRGLGLTYSLYSSELARCRAAGVGIVAGVGLGCTLIRRKVLERVPWRARPGEACDMPFALDCLRKRIDALGRFDTPCDHYDGTRWLTPYNEADELVRVRALVTQDGMKAGRYYTRRYVEARQMATAGLVDLCPS